MSCSRAWVWSFLPALLLSFWIATPLLAERLAIRIYTNEHGLPQRQVLALAQDATGYLWVGTYGGLSRFNGRAFVTLRTRHGLSSNSVADVVPLADGRLWVGTSGGGVCLVQNLKALRCFRAPQCLPSDDVLDLEGDGGDGVWAGTFEGVAHLRADGSSEIFRQVEGKALGNVWSVRRTGHRVLVGFAAGLAEIQGNYAKLLPVALPAAVRALLPSPGGIYIGTERGLFRIPPLGKEGQLELIATNVFVQDLASFEGTIWAATRTGVLR